MAPFNEPFVTYLRYTVRNDVSVLRRFQDDAAFSPFMLFHFDCIQNVRNQYKTVVDIRLLRAGVAPGGSRRVYAFSRRLAIVCRHEVIHKTGST